MIKYFHKNNFPILFIFVLYITIIYVSLFIFSCSSGQFDTSYVNIENKTFRQDLVVDINGEHFVGSGLVKKAQDYNVVVYPDDKVERIIYSTCHEEQVIDKPKTNGWFRKSISFTLKNVPNVSDVSSCSLEIIVLDEQSRRNAFATIEFQDQRPEVQLPALVKCNGVIQQYNSGVSICQSAMGLIQQINFNEPVIQAGVKGSCDVMKSIDDKTFAFMMPKGKCTYYFGSNRKLNGKRLLARLQTIGYSDIPFTK
jgi:hypothetical protein